MAFESIARFYDIDDGRLSEDIPFHLGFARKTGGPVLDLGVGSGRLAIPIARLGIPVVGIDISGSMLAIGQRRINEQRLADRIHLIQADFREPPLLPGHFSLAYCGYNAFLHLIETYEQLDALIAWKGLLKPGGLLVIDVENLQLEGLARMNAQKSLELEESFLEPETGAPVLKFTETEINLPDQTLTIHRLYERLSADGNWERFETRFQVRILFQRELELLLTCAGYDNLRFYGDFELNPWTPESPRLIAVASA